MKRTGIKKDVLDALAEVGDPMTSLEIAALKSRRANSVSSALSSLAYELVPEVSRLAGKKPYHYVLSADVVERESTFDFTIPGVDSSPHGLVTTTVMDVNAKHGNALEAQSSLIHAKDILDLHDEVSDPRVKESLLCSLRLVLGGVS